MNNKKIAAVFPGQGSQSVGMLNELYTEYECVRDTCAEASDILGYDIWELMQAGPEEKLKQTAFTQPVMFVSGIAVWRAWQAAGGAEISLFAGHSLGEYAALTAAGLFEFKESLALVAERGRLMEQAVPVGVGGMAAILGMEDEEVINFCQTIRGERVLEAVNFNSVGQVAISGHLEAVEEAVDQAKEAGARKAVLLPVSVPNHSSLMTAAVQPLAERIDQMTIGQVSAPVIQNLEAKSYSHNNEILDALKKHVSSPVYWTDSVREMKNQGVEVIVELGPGKVLTGLSKRIDRTMQGTFVQDLATMEKSIALCQ